MRKAIAIVAALAVAMLASASLGAAQDAPQSNILVIWGDNSGT